MSTDNEGAVSRPKCNELMMMLKELEGRWHEEFGGTLPAEALAGAGVELPGDVIEFGLRGRRQIAPLGGILAQQAVGVFVDGALPRAVRIGEIDLYAGGFGKALGLGHFAALIVGQGKSPLRVDALEDR